MSIIKDMHVRDDLLGIEAYVARIEDDSLPSGVRFALVHRDTEADELIERVESLNFEPILNRFNKIKAAIA